MPDREAIRVPLPVPVAAWIGEHVGARVAVGPVVRGLVEVGRDDLADVPGEPVDRRLAARAHAENPGVVAQNAERPEGAKGHRDLPVLPVLAARGEVRIAEVLAIGRVDVADQLPELGVGEVLELAELAVAE